MEQDKMREEFEKLAKPLIEYLCKNHNPHVSVIITPISAELLEGSIAFSTNEFLRD